jgi:hypothetical protein
MKYVCANYNSLVFGEYKLSRLAKMALGKAGILPVTWLDYRTSDRFCDFLADIRP